MKSEAGGLGHVGCWSQPVSSVSYKLMALTSSRLLCSRDEWWQINLVPSTKIKASELAELIPGLKKEIKGGCCSLQDTVETVLHPSHRGAPELGLLQGSGLLVNFWQTASPRTGKGNDHIRSAYDSHLQIWWAQKGPLIQKKLAPSYCVGGNTLIRNIGIVSCRFNHCQWSVTELPILYCIRSF